MTDELPGMWENADLTGGATDAEPRIVQSGPLAGAKVTMIKTPKKGERYRWTGVTLSVLRVAKDGTWADIYCEAPGLTPWSKRQHIPPRVLIHWERLP